MDNELSLVISNPEKENFLKKIEWNKEEFMELVASITEQYKGLTYTEEQINAAKKDRAKLNAMKKAVSDRRIEVKKAIMAPYTQFEKELEEVVELIEKPIEMIDIQIKEYEKMVKEEKEHTLVEFFKEIAKELDGILTFDMIFDKKWLNASVSLKKAKDEIQEKVNKVNTDLRTIETMCREKYRTVIKDYYTKTLDISKALQEESRLIELDRKMEEERERKAEEERLKAEQQRAEEEAEMEAANNTEVVAENKESVSETPQSVSKQDEGIVPPPTGDSHITDPFNSQEDTKQYKASFTVYGTKAQIMELKQYMVDNNIKFGKVEK